MPAGSYSSVRTRPRGRTASLSGGRRHVAAGRAACQRAARVLRDATALRVTRRPPRGSDGSYGPCGPAWTERPGRPRPSRDAGRPPDSGMARRTGTGWGRQSRPFTTSPRPAADPGFRVVRPARSGRRAVAVGVGRGANSRGRRGGPFGLPFPSLYSCEHNVTDRDLEQPFRADGRKLTKERRHAPTSVHVRRIPRSRSPDLAFNFTGMRRVPFGLVKSAEGLLKASTQHPAASAPVVLRARLSASQNHRRIQPWCLVWNGTGALTSPLPTRRPTPPRRNTAAR